MQTVDVLGGVLEGGPAVPLAIERVLAMLASQRPRADILEPFVEAARDVLATELGSEVTPGKLSVATGSLTTLDITVVVGMTGHVTGIAIYGLSDNLAHGILGQMRGSPIEELDDMALSGIAELANVIAGRASTYLTRQGLHTRNGPPTVLIGAGSRLSTVNIHRLAVPLATEHGTLETQLAIKVTSAKLLSPLDD